MLYDSDNNENVTAQELGISQKRYAEVVVKSLNATETEGHVRAGEQRVYAMPDTSMDCTEEFAHQTPNGGWAFRHSGENPFETEGSPDDSDALAKTDTYRETVAWEGRVLRFEGKIGWNAEEWKEMKIEELT